MENPRGSPPSERWPWRVGRHPPRRGARGPVPPLRVPGQRGFAEGNAVECNQPSIPRDKYRNAAALHARGVSMCRRQTRPILVVMFVLLLPAIPEVMAQGAWSTTGRLRQGRTYHTGTLLTDSAVLVAGGLEGGLVVSSA